MNAPSPFTQLETLYLEALGLPEPERSDFLAGACCDDALRARVRLLLAGGATVATTLLRDAAGLTLLTTACELLPIHLDRYELVARLGEGAFGVVYRGVQHTPVRREVAVKVLRPGLDSREIVRRFEAERQALACLDHPNIAKLFDAGNTPDGRPYFVMELIRGSPLTHFCNCRSLSIRQRLALMLEVCAAVEHAHSRGILHRDLKPSNILVAERPEGGAAALKVIDFGIARALGAVGGGMGSVATEAGQLLGTPEYMSPEQVDGEPGDVDTRTDVYALGVLLYELLAGRLPFPSAELRSVRFSELRRKICEVEPPAPGSVWGADETGLASAAACRGATSHGLRQTLGGEIGWVALRAMRKLPAERYGGVTELADDLRNYLEGRPLRAGPASAAYRARKFVRRYRALVVTTLAVVSLMALAVLGTTAGILEAGRQRVLADGRKTDADAQRVRADVQSAQALVARGESALQQSHFPEAWDAMAEARRVYARLGRSTAPADLGLYSVLAAADLPVLVMKAGTTPIEWLGFVDGGATLISTDALGTSEWETRRGRRCRRYPMRVLGASPDGRILYARDGDGSLSSYERHTLRREVTYGSAPTTDARQLGVAPNGKWIVQCDGGYFVAWEAESGRNLGRFKVCDTRIRAAAFSPDSSRLVFAGDDLFALPVWDTATWSEQKRLKAERSLICAAFTPDGASVLTGGWKYVPLLMDLETGRAARTFGGHRQEVNRVIASPDGRWAVSVSSDTSVRLSSLTGDRRDRLMVGHSSAVRTVAFAPSGERFATASDDGEIRVWDLRVAGVELELKRQNAGQHWVVPLSDDGRLAVMLSDSKHVETEVWDTDRGKILSRLDTGGCRLVGPGTRFITSAGNAVLGITDDAAATVYLWDPTTGRKLRTLAVHGGSPRGVVATPDGRRGISYGDRSGMKVWDFEKGAQLWQWTDPGPVRRECAISVDGKYAAASTAGGAIEFAEVETGRRIRTIHTLPDSDRFAYALFDPRNSDRVVVYHELDPRPRMIRLSDGSQVWSAGGQPMQRSNWYVVPDGRYLISRNGDQTLDFLDPDDGRRLFSASLSHPAADVTASRDFSRLAYVSNTDDWGIVIDLTLAPRLADLEPAVARARTKLAGAPADGRPDPADEAAVDAWCRLLLTRR